MPSRTLNAHALLRSLDLMVDGPVRWAQPVRSRRAGIFLVEQPAAERFAQLDILAIRAWVDRVPTLKLDGVRPEPAALADRLRSFWLPGQQVLYVGRTTKSLGARVAGLYGTPLGDRRPHSGGHWLRTLKGTEGLRIWWAETDAPEEYEDAVVSAIADTLTAEERAALPAGVVLPWANLEAVGGDKRSTGITGSLLDNDTSVTGTAATRAAPGPPVKPVGTRSTASRTAGAARPTAARASAPRTARTAAASTTTGPTHITATGLEGLKRELDELVTVKRPEVIARVKSARELGDLRENADYEAARNEQSFLEGRVRALEQLIKTAQVIDADHTGEVILGSTVQVLVEGEETTLHIVGSTEADPANGRISNASPVGRALMGHRAGDEVLIATPARSLHYRIVEVRQLDG